MANEATEDRTPNPIGVVIVYLPIPRTREGMGLKSDWSSCGTPVAEWRPISLPDAAAISLDSPKRTKDHDKDSSRRTKDREERAVARKRSVEARYRESGTKAVPSTGQLPGTALWEVLQASKSTQERSKALVELMRRADDRVAEFVVRQLVIEELSPSWRNSLVFAAEHLDFEDGDGRRRLRDRLGGLVSSLNDEWHPRSRGAQAAAFRRYISLLEDNTGLNTLRPFLSTAYPVRIRRIALLGIQKSFAEEPPAGDVLTKLTPLCEELRELAMYLLRPGATEQSEADFFLGLDALDALIRLGDPQCAELVRRATGSGRRWVAKQLKLMLESTRHTWARGDSGRSTDCLGALDSALDILTPGDAGPRR